MRILIVAMSGSIHVARWLKQLTDQGWDIHLFPSAGNDAPHAAMRDLTLHAAAPFPPGQIDPSVRVCLPPPALVGCDHPTRLAEVIERVQPDIIHSMEFQHCSYLTLDARKRYAGQFPPWAVSNWGSDIYLFGRLPAHAERIRDVLAHCDFYYCECCRDVKLARQFGFQGEVLPVFPVAGGFDLVHTAQFRRPGPTSDRRVVLLKGYQHFAGRALVGLRALRLCAAELRAGNYRVAIYHANDDVALAAELFAEETGVPVELIPYSGHDDMLRRFGQARVYLGLSISDAISTSLLEAMIMGAFPIQSWTACADEWIVDGETGMLVPPEDPHDVAAALRQALTDDALVNAAAQRNAALSQKRLDVRIIAPQVTSLYRHIIRQSPPRDRQAKPEPAPSTGIKPPSVADSMRAARRRMTFVRNAIPRARRVLGYGWRLISALRRHGVRLTLAKLLSKVASRSQRYANRLNSGC